jgi:hypothetical protein
MMKVRDCWWEALLRRYFAEDRKLQSETRGGGIVRLRRCRGRLAWSKEALEL